MGSCLGSCQCNCNCIRNRHRSQRRSNEGDRCNHRSNSLTSLNNQLSSMFGGVVGSTGIGGDSNVGVHNESSRGSGGSIMLEQHNNSNNLINIVLNDDISLNHVPTGRNKRLKKDKFKWKSDVNMTIEELERKRVEFWDTAPVFGGRIEIWNALKAACNVIESNNNFELAQAIIDSAQITLPTGTLNDCYDELGNRYQLPNYVVIKPINLHASGKPVDLTDSNNKQQQQQQLDVIKTSPVNNNNETTTAATSTNQSITTQATTTTTTSTTTNLQTTTENNSDLNNNNNNTKNEIALKFRLSNSLNSSDLKILLDTNLTIEQVKQKIYELKQIEPVRQRMYFGGKMLSDKLKLKQMKLQKNFVIQVIIREDTTTTTTTTTQ